MAGQYSKWILNKIRQEDEDYINVTQARLTWLLRTEQW